MRVKLDLKRLVKNQVKSFVTSQVITHSNVFLVRFDNEVTEMYNKARNLQTFISKQSEQLIKAVETQKDYHMDTIEKHRQTYKQS